MMLGNIAAWMSAQKCRAWYAWAVFVPARFRNTLVPGWKYLHPFLHHWLRIPTNERAAYAQRFLLDSAGPFVRALQRGRVLRLMLELIEGGTPSAEIQASFQPVLLIDDPLMPGEPQPNGRDMNADGTALSEAGAARLAEVKRQQADTYADALAAVDKARRAQVAVLVDWHTISAGTIGVWSAMGILPEGVIP